MRIPKRYGQSKIENCPFCGKQGVTKNSQGIPVCQSHKEHDIENLKCACGEWLDTREGKWGPYFHCMNCGNINFKKGMEMNPQVKQKNSQDKDQAKKEVTVTSDQVDYLY